MSDLVFGIEWFDRNFSKALRLKPLIVISGGPGSGKTTFACTMCYANAVRGNKCLYITFYEDKEKLLQVMADLGLNLREVEAKGLLKFVKVPTTVSQQLVWEVITKSAEEFNPKVVIIDSVTLALLPMGDPSERRAFIQNFLYELPEKVGGCVVLVVESLGRDGMKYLNDLYFAADIVINLRNVIERGLMRRTMEIVKMRGCETKLSEVSYGIADGRGIELYPRPFLEEIPSDGRELRLLCEPLQRALKHLHLGMSIYITYPPDDRPHEVFPMLTGLLIENNLKCLIINYNQPPGAIREQIIKSLKKYRLDDELAERVVDTHYTIVGINPYAYTLSTLLTRLQSLTLEIRDFEVIMFMDISLVSVVHDVGQYIPMMYDNINYLKLNKKLVIRAGSYIDEKNYKINAMLSDVVISFRTHYEGAERKISVHLWRRGEEHVILDYDEVKKCCREIIQAIKEKSKTSNPTN